MISWPNWDFSNRWILLPLTSWHFTQGSVPTPEGMLFTACLCGLWRGVLGGVFFGSNEITDERYGLETTKLIPRSGWFWDLGLSMTTILDSEPQKPKNGSGSKVFPSRPDRRPYHMEMTTLSSAPSRPKPLSCGDHSIGPTIGGCISVRNGFGPISIWPWGCVTMGNHGRPWLEWVTAEQWLQA